MEQFIDGYNFCEMNAMKYYAPPASWDKDKRFQNAHTKIFSNDWYGAEKKDGYFTKIVKDEEGKCYLFSRSRNTKGEYVNKIEWVPQFNSFFENLPNGTCLLGELYFPKRPGSNTVTTIMQCLKDKALARQNADEKLHLYLFDLLAYNNKSLLKSGALERFNLLESLRPIFSNEYIEVAHYINGQELWMQLQILLASGAEGIVITEKNAIYEPDKRPSKTTLKVKQELKDTIDVVIIGANPPTREYGGKEILTWQYWEDTVSGERLRGEYYKRYSDGGTIEPVTKAYWNNWAGSLRIGMRKDDKVIEVGSLSGITEEVLSNWKDYVGKVAEITAMQVFMDTGGLRHPKFLNWRPDKTARDTDWYAVFGK